MAVDGHSHWWSGWPGAHCLKCGASDPAEEHLADGEIDFETGLLLFESEEERERFEARLRCPVKDDPEKHPWLTF